MFYYEVQVVWLMQILSVFVRKARKSEVRVGENSENSALRGGFSVVFWLRNCSINVHNVLKML